MTGIELLQMIKNGELKDETKINVIRLTENVNVYDYSTVTTITFIHNNLEWPAGTFKSSMLWDNDYLFEIMESEESSDKAEKIGKLSYQQLGTYQLDNNDTLEFIKSLNDQLTKHGRKINDLIETVNYLLDTQNKG